MKKIDIEKWDRKTPELPENFFDEMQEKVLAQTVYKKEPKRFKIQWRWASAAAIALIIGLGAFLNSNRDEQKNLITAQNEKAISNSTPSINTDKKEVTDHILTPEHGGNSLPRVGFATQETENTQKLNPEEIQTKEKIEKVLNAMNEEDFKDLAANYEQDVYLELY